MRPLCGAVLLALITTSVPAGAQDLDLYLGFVHEYAGGAGGQALTDLALLPIATASNAAKRAAATADVDDLFAAAVLHTELATLLADSRLSDVRAHLEAAHDLLKAAATRAGALERTRAITERWYEYVASLYTSMGRTRDAEPYVRRGLAEFPRAPMLYVARGAIAEMNVRTTAEAGPSGPGARIDALLTTASTDYLRALRLDPDNPVAHLRLGWIRFVQRNGRAKADFDEALADGATNRTRYLAHVFLGGLLERDGRLTDAGAEYEAALSVSAAYQTAYVALSRVETALGHDDRARALADQCARIVKHDDDPWWDFRSTFDWEALLWLRAEVQR